ncbi:MAG: NifB/NifX family molybdenum-iron cluster-binding protein [Candidatus Thermoplasmatota archaeon]|nr:NifB/NifX family molybdenum-iron cluster-binding protein [Candidatus Thermoplasmatota archaeon]
MKVGIPSNGKKGLEEQVGQHFGRVTHYTLVNLDTDKVTVIQNTSHHMGGTMQPPELLKKEGVDVMLCSGLGRRAINLFEQMGIDVYIGASGLVRDAIGAFKEGSLKQATIGDGCQEHTFGGHHHH